LRRFVIPFAVAAIFLLALLLVWPVLSCGFYINTSSVLAGVLPTLEANLGLPVEILGLLFLPAVINWGIQPLFAPLFVDTETKRMFAYNTRQTQFSTEDKPAETEYCLRSRLILSIKPPLIILVRRIVYLLPGHLAIRKIDPHTSSIKVDCSKRDKDWALGFNTNVSGFRLSRCKVDVVCDEVADPEVVVETGEPTFSGSGFEATRTVVVTNIESFSIRGYVARITLSEKETKLLQRQVLIDGQPIAADRFAQRANQIRILLDLDRLERKVLTVQLMSETQ